MNLNAQLILQALKSLSQQPTVQQYGGDMSTIIDYAKSISGGKPLSQKEAEYRQKYARFGSDKLDPAKEAMSPVNMAQAQEQAMGWTGGGVAGFTKPMMTGFRRAIPLTNQGVITKEQIPIMKEIGLFDKAPDFQQDFIKTMGAEMRYIQNKAHIEGWDKARTTKAYRDMEQRFTIEKMLQGPQQVMSR